MGKRKQTKPRFSEGEKVVHLCGRLEARATILALVNEGDGEDIEVQGHRYYVAHHRQVWSVPESALALAVGPKQGPAGTSNFKRLERAFFLNSPSGWFSL